MTSQLQNLLIIIGIILLAVIGYYLFVRDGDVSLNNSLVNNQAFVETTIFLQRLNELKQINLDGKIFDDVRFTSLVDYSQPVSAVAIGRDNPFSER